MRILLVNLPWQRKDKRGVRAGSRWPHIKDKTEGSYMPFPFFLAYAAALLEKNDFEIRLIDAIAENMSEGKFLVETHNFNPDLLIVETSTGSLNDDLKLIDKIDPSIPIVLCGPDINIRRKEFLEENRRIGFVLKGEYEYILLELAKALRDGIDLTNVMGVNFRDKNNEVITNPGRPLIDNLDMLQWPLREQLPIYEYHDAPGDLPAPSVQMITSRGCPYGCTFCLWPQVMYGGRNYRVRSPQDVVAEMEYLINAYNFKSIYFDDDTFGLDKVWLGEFIKILKQQKLDIPWAMMTRTDAMDKRILEEMKSVGLYAVKYGIESADQELINRCRKNSNLAQAKQIINVTKKTGIKVHLTFMFGLPGETKNTIKRTIISALEFKPDSVQFSIVTPFPGTEYYEELSKKGCITSTDWSDYDGNYKCVFNLNNLQPNELKKAKDNAYFICYEGYKLSLLRKLIFFLKILGPNFAFCRMIKFFQKIINYQSKATNRFFIRLVFILPIVFIELVYAFARGIRNRVEKILYI